MKNRIYLLGSLLACVSLFGQPGKNGTLTVSTHTVLNHYSPLTANAAVGSTMVTVLGQSTLLNLCPGDLIMLYQAQGAIISTTNTVSYGAISSYNSSGLYEFVYVKKVTGNNIELSNALINAYSTVGMAQIIKAPQYSTLTINPAALINPRPWKDTMVSTILYRFGGIVAIHAASIVNNGTITASGAGFRGGQLDILNTSAYSSGITEYVSTINSYGGEKGESIAGYQPEYDVMNGRYSRGAPANGGGGGNGWNSAGGGGANGNNSNAWTGQGVMVVNSSNPLSAWSLDPGYAANSNALTNSSGGGRGGYSVSFNNMNPLTTAPGNFSWSGDNRSEVGGLGGRPLTNISSANRIYFGGGGGAGDENNANGGAGGSGGGIVYLITTNTISGSGVISSDGENGFSTTGNGYDAPGGGGAGGSIVIIAGSMSPNQTISATGGKGGDQFVSTETEGPGGGGGGGFVALSSGTLSPNISGGIGGTTNSPALTQFPFNGATSGASGQTGTVTLSSIHLSYSGNLSVSPGSTTICIGKSVVLSASGAGNYTWQPGGSNSPTVSVSPVVNTSYTVSAFSGTCAVSSVVTVQVQDCTGLSQWENDTQKFTVCPNPSNGSFSILALNETPFDAKIYNSIGEVIFTQMNASGKTLFNLTGQPKGVYYLVIRQQENKRFEKIIIE